MAVLVLDKAKRPLMPCTPKRARKLLAAGRARVHRLFPFCIRLVDRHLEQSTLQPLRLSLDPGSKTTGLAISRIAEVLDSDGVIEPVMHIVFLMELAHRGRAIMETLHARAAMRRRRRSNLRYRAPRFSNRTRPKGWLPPSLEHRIDTMTAWVTRFRRLAPITHLAQELVRFDMQRMQNPDISGVEYQQGTLAGYEVREYLLEKFNRTCAYCDVKNVPLQIEHVHAKARGGSNRISNLTLACGHCNLKKDARDIRDFLAKDPTRLGSASGLEADRSSGRNRHWRTNEMESEPLGYSKNACARRCVCRCSAGRARHDSTDAACHLRGTRFALQVAAEQVWVPSRVSHAEKDSIWISNRRHGAGDRTDGQEQGHAQGPSGHPDDGQLQHPARNSGCACCAGDFAQTLQSPAACRRLWLYMAGHI